MGINASRQLNDYYTTIVNPSALFIALKDKLKVNGYDKPVSHFKAVIGEGLEDKLLNHIETFISFLRGANEVMRDIFSDYELTDFKVKDQHDEEINVQINKRDLGGRELRTAIVTTGNQDRVFNSGRLMDVYQFIKEKNRYFCLSSSEINTEFLNEIEGGLLSILEKKDREDYLQVNDLSSNLIGLRSSAVYIMDDCGSNFLCVKGESIKDEFSDNEELTPSFLSAARTFINTIFNECEIDYFSLQKDLRKIKIYYRPFEIEQEKFTLVVAVRGDVDNLDLSNKLTEIVTIMKKEGWRKYLSTNQLPPEHIQKAIEERISEVLK